MSYKIIPPHGSLILFLFMNLPVCRSRKILYYWSRFASFLNLLRNYCELDVFLLTSADFISHELQTLCYWITGHRQIQFHKIFSSCLCLRLPLRPHEFSWSVICSLKSIFETIWDGRQDKISQGHVVGFGIFTAIFLTEGFGSQNLPMFVSKINQFTYVCKYENDILELDTFSILQ